MDNCRLVELLGQADADATGEVFREFLRGGCASPAIFVVFVFGPSGPESESKRTLT